MLMPVTEMRIGQWCQGVAWTRDSRTVLVQCMTEREITGFRFDGRALTSAGAIKVNGGPAGIRGGTIQRDRRARRPRAQGAS